MLTKVEAQGLHLKADWRERIKPDPLGPIHNSRKSFWRLWRPAPRVIPAGALVHESVRVRMGDETLQYNPANLPPKHTVVPGR